MFLVTMLKKGKTKSFVLRLLLYILHNPLNVGWSHWFKKQYLLMALSQVLLTSQYVKAANNEDLEVASV